MKQTKILLLPTFAFLLSCGNKNEKPTPETSEKKPDTSFINPKIVNPYAIVDVSPMDMSYFPVDYAKLKMTKQVNTPPVMRVIYSRPHKQGRQIFGKLLKYGQAWRLGANEATEIEFFQPVTIQNKKVSPGRYIMYSIPQEDKWTIVLNSNIYTWGLQTDSTRDLMRFDAQVKKAPVNFEYFTMTFQPITGGAELIMAWDEVEARLPIEF